MKKQTSQVLKNKDFLSLLARTKSKQQQKKLINFASKDQIHSLLEIILNLKRKKLVLNKTQRKRLTKYKRAFKLLLDSKQVGKQKQILNQTGTGFLPILLPSVISAIAGLLKK